MTVTDISTYTDHNGQAVTSFCMHFRNDRNRVRASMKQQVAAMLMANIRELWDTGAWRSYRTALGTFEWREHEFDYFLASCMMAPADIAEIVRAGSWDDWAALINSTNPGKGNKQGRTRRLLAEVAAQIRLGIPGGMGDADIWVHHAADGFGDRNDQQIAKSKTKLRQAKASSLTAVKDGPQVVVHTRGKRDPSKSETEQQAELILAWLDRHPDVKCIVHDTFGRSG